MVKTKIENNQKSLRKSMKEKFTEDPLAKATVFAREGLKLSERKMEFIRSGQKIPVKRGITSYDSPHIQNQQCTFCRGKLKQGTTEFIARAGGEVVIIKDVPAYVCEQCGEAYYTTTTSRKIDSVMRDVHKKKLCVRPVPAGEVSLNS